MEAPRPRGRVSWTLREGTLYFATMYGLVFIARPRR